MVAHAFALSGQLVWATIRGAGRSWLYASEARRQPLIGRNSMLMFLIERFHLDLDSKDLAFTRGRMPP